MCCVLLEKMRGPVGWAKIKAWVSFLACTQSLKLAVWAAILKFLIFLLFSGNCFLDRYLNRYCPTLHALMARSISERAVNLPFGVMTSLKQKLINSKQKRNIATRKHKFCSNWGLNFIPSYRFVGDAAVLSKEFFAPLDATQIANWYFKLKKNWTAEKTKSFSVRLKA